MQISKKLKNPVIFGTLLLTAAGVLSKIIGFFYRIFLSRTIGAEELGIYQLIFPISTICFAVTVSGLSTALSKYVAEFQAKGSAAPGRLLRFCILISGGLSFAAAFLLFRYSKFIADNILLEPRCQPLIPILACSIPLASIHSCIHGYYYGKKKAAIPAVSSLIEQGVRVLFVFIVCHIQFEQKKTIDASCAVWGLVFGEGAASLFCVTALLFSKNIPVSLDRLTLKSPAKKLLTYSIPLSMNRLALTLFSSFESILIPSRLGCFGYSASDALSVYGVLTGMALSVVMFPSVLSNSISVMILPVISEADSRNDCAKIHHTIQQTIFGSLFIGCLCTIGFLFTGKWIGDVLFANALAGKLIRMLSFICPFWFLSSISSSILHGLGMPGYTFLLNLLGSSIRICFVFFFIPVYGIKAYLIGLLISQILIAVLSVYLLRKNQLYSNVQ